MDPFYRKHIILEPQKLEWLLNKLEGGIDVELTKEKHALLAATLVAWDTLPMDLQTAVWEYDVENRGYKDIAQKEGVAISTIWKRRQRAIKKMRNYLMKNHKELIDACIR